MQTNKLNNIQITEETGRKHNVLSDIQTIQVTGRKPSITKLALLFTLFGFSAYVWTKISRMIVDEMERK